MKNENINTDFNFYDLILQLIIHLITARRYDMYGFL